MDWLSTRPRYVRVGRTVGLVLLGFAVGAAFGVWIASPEFSFGDVLEPVATLSVGCLAVVLFDAGRDNRALVRGRVLQLLQDVDESLADCSSTYLGSESRPLSFERCQHYVAEFQRTETRCREIGVLLDSVITSSTQPKPYSDLAGALEEIFDYTTVDLPTEGFEPKKHDLNRSRVAFADAKRALNALRIHVLTAI